MTTSKAVDPQVFWDNGYSIGELFGRSAPVSRGGPHLEDRHLILWAILSIVDQQVSEGAGRKYLQERLHQGDWVAIGDINGETVVVPPIENAQLGRKPSSVGDGNVKYVNVRVLHRATFDLIQADLTSQDRPL